MLNILAITYFYEISRKRDETWRKSKETGATFLVMGSDVTVPPLVVNMVESLAIPAALFASTYLIVLSLVLLFIFRVAVKKR